MAYEKTKLMNLEDGQEVLKSLDTKLVSEITNLKSAIEDTSKAGVAYHLGFYLDSDGDLCQVD